MPLRFYTMWFIHCYIMPWPSCLYVYWLSHFMTRHRRSDETRRSMLQASACAIWITTYNIVSRVHLHVVFAMSWESVCVQTCGSDHLWVHPSTSSRTSHCIGVPHIRIARILLCNCPASWGCQASPDFRSLYLENFWLSDFRTRLGGQNLQFATLAWDCVSLCVLIVFKRFCQKLTK
jgi:hypothetical protein